MVRMVELSQPPVGGLKLAIGGTRTDPQDRVRITYRRCHRISVVVVATVVRSCGETAGPRLELDADGVDDPGD